MNIETNQFVAVWIESSQEIVIVRANKERFSIFLENNEWTRKGEILPLEFHAQLYHYRTHNKMFGMPYPVVPVFDIIGMMNEIAYFIDQYPEMTFMAEDGQLKDNFIICANYLSKHYDADKEMIIKNLLTTFKEKEHEPQ